SGSPLNVAKALEHVRERHKNRLNPNRTLPRVLFVIVASSCSIDTSCYGSLIGISDRGTGHVSVTRRRAFAKVGCTLFLHHRVICGPTVFFTWSDDAKSSRTQGRQSAAR